MKEKLRASIKDLIQGRLRSHRAQGSPDPTQVQPPRNLVRLRWARKGSTFELWNFHRKVGVVYSDGSWCARYRGSRFSGKEDDVDSARVAAFIAVRGVARAAGQRVQRA